MQDRHVIVDDSRYDGLRFKFTSPDVALFHSVKQSQFEQIADPVPHEQLPAMCREDHLRIRK